MKKVLLTKSQLIQPVIPDGSDLLLAKQPTPVRLISMPAPMGTTTYIQRKSCQVIYEEIFKLLMRLPDKALTQRVIDAINNRSSSDKVAISNQGKQCSCRAQKVDSSTQTETEPQERTTKPLKRPDLINESSTGNTNSPQATSSSSHIKTPNEPQKVPKKRGRKRNTCVPQVVKRSAAEMALQEREEKQLTPVVTKKKKQEGPDFFNAAENMHSKATPQRRESTNSNISFNFDEMTLVEDYINGSNKDRIIRIMANEFKKARIMSEEGLLPIHDEILDGNVFGVNRQIFVCLHDKMDINELLTSDGEDCLELALTNDADTEIISLILSAHCHTDNLYENSNTALHLAVINNINIESFRLLMRRIDLNILLLTNDDGYTVLHLAVRNNQFLIAEAILDIIDERELGETVYRRTQESSNANDADEKAFAKYYDRACERLELSKQKLKNRRHKMDVINASEARGGNPPLFYAVEGEQEHLCYFLLAHLADPDEENLSGHSPKSFHYEYARTLRINLKVARVMEKVVGILNS